MRPVTDIADRRDAALREQFIALAGQAFDFALAFASRVAAPVTSAVPARVPDPPLRVKEAALRLAISESAFREKLRAGHFESAVIRIPSTGGKRPQIRFVASAIDALATHATPNTVRGTASGAR